MLLFVVLFLVSKMMVAQELPEPTKYVVDLFAKSGTLYRGSDDWKGKLNNLGDFVRTVYVQSGDELLTGYNASYRYMSWLSKNATKATFFAAVGFGTIVIRSTTEELTIIRPKNREHEQQLAKRIPVDTVSELKDAYSKCSVAHTRRYDKEKHQFRDYKTKRCVTELQLGVFKECMLSGKNAR